MEKNGRLILTQEEFHLFRLGKLALSLAEKGVTSYSQLEEIIKNEEYVIV